MRLESQRGFTLAEVLVATAIAFALGWVLISLAHATVLGATRLDARVGARTAADRLGERLDSDASTAWSVFVPASDVLGASNADGHELDFVTEDASQQTIWWAYAYDAAADRVTEYTYAPARGAPSAGDVFDGVTLQAEVHPVTDLASASSDVYDPLFAGANATAIDFDYGWNAAAAVGGNHLVRAHLTATGIDRVLLLASGTAPSHFSIIVDYTPPPATPTP